MGTYILVDILIVMITVVVYLMYKLEIIFTNYEDYEDEREQIMLTIKVKYLRDIKPIVILDDGDWIDLRAGADVVLEAGGWCCIPLGVAMQLPEGYSAIIAPRSSTFAKWGIIQTNSIGIIDNSYNGDGDEWQLPVLAFRKTTIHKNDRICQFRLVPNSDFVDMVKVNTLGNDNRGGFGSTGHE